MNSSDCHTNLEDNSTSKDSCKECSKNLKKIKFLEKNNENMRKKYKILMNEVSELRKLQIPNETSMTIENQTDESEEWCEVCWKKIHSDDEQHICLEDIKAIRCESCSKLFNRP